MIIVELYSQVGFGERAVSHSLVDPIIFSDSVRECLLLCATCQLMQKPIKYSRGDCRVLQVFQMIISLSWFDNLLLQTLRKCVRWLASKGHRIASLGVLWVLGGCYDCELARVSVNS